MKPIDVLWKMKPGDKVRLGKGMFTVKRLLDDKKKDERVLDLGNGFLVVLTKTGYKVARISEPGEAVRVTKVKKE